jgi:hypothetical protein
MFIEKDTFCKIMMMRDLLCRSLFCFDKSVVLYQYSLQAFKIEKRIEFIENSYISVFSILWQFYRICVFLE